MATRMLLVYAAVGALAACGQGGGGNEAAPVASNQAGAASKERPGRTILDTVSQSADHSIFANALRAAGLTETMSGAGPYTVFAPTNAAFQKLPAGAADELLTPEAKGRLVGLLTYHVVPGVVTAADIGRAIDKGKGKAELATVGGTNLSFTRSGATVAVTDGKGGQARLARPDLLQSNGVVHSLDAVLMPQ